MEYVTLTNGLKMPTVGFGVFRVPDKKECQESVYQAIKTGYRLIDTAASSPQDPRQPTKDAHRPCPQAFRSLQSARCTSPSLLQIYRNGGSRNHISSSLNTSAWNVRNTASPLFHASLGSPAFKESAESISSFVHPVSSATCGRNTALRPESERIIPSRWRMKLSRLLISIGFVSSDISIVHSSSSEGERGGKRGSEKAESIASCAISLSRSATASRYPMHPLSSPCFRRVTNAPYRSPLSSVLILSPFIALLAMERSSFFLSFVISPPEDGAVGDEIRPVSIAVRAWWRHHHIAF